LLEAVEVSAISAGPYGKARAEDVSLNHKPALQHREWRAGIVILKSR
jgi:hypothetical protein